MNKKVFFIFTFIAIVAIAAWNVNSNSLIKGMSALSLSNIEALADDEIETPTNCPGGLVLCAWITGCPDCPVTYYKE